MRNPKKSSKSKSALQRERELRNWTQAELAEALYNLCLEEDEDKIKEINAKMVGVWERGEHFPSLFWRKKLCQVFGKNAEELGFVDAQTIQPTKTENKETHESVQASPIFVITREQFASLSLTGSFFISDKGTVPSSPNFSTGDLLVFDLGVAEQLENAECIINLAWEAWFASRPREVARSVNKLLPGLEKIAHSPYLSKSQILQAKELVIRAHGLLGSVCLDAVQNDTALYHYTQAHRFAQEIHNRDLATIYLCLVGEVLRQQNNHSSALSYMENARDLASGASNATRGHVLQLLAYTYGDIGQEEAFERTISEATDLLSFSGEGIDIPQKEFIPFEIYEIRGKVYRDLGKPLNAIPYLDLAEKSLTTSNSVIPRWHALLEISRAQAYCDAGDITMGTELACKGFIKAYQCRSQHQMNRVRKLLRKLENGSARTHPGVQELKNVLIEVYLRPDAEDVSKKFSSF